MTINDMKRTLAKKLKAEDTYFTFKDISIKEGKPTETWSVDKMYTIIIKDYEHIQFRMFFDIDDYFGNSVAIFRQDVNTKTGENEGDSRYIIDVDGAKSFDELTEEALINLGYYIGTRF